MGFDPVFIGLSIMVHFRGAIDHNGFALADAFEPVVDVRRDLQKDGVVFPHEEFI